LLAAGSDIRISREASVIEASEIYLEDTISSITIAFTGKGDK
jgi:hypothetical protein